MLIGYTVRLVIPTVPPVVYSRTPGQLWQYSYYYFFNSYSRTPWQLWQYSSLVMTAMAGPPDSRDNTLHNFLGQL
jgi:hypothetical protein